jgi:hypothetical protein
MGVEASHACEKERAMNTDSTGMASAGSQNAVPRPTWQTPELLERALSSFALNTPGAGFDENQQNDVGSGCC